MSAPGLTHEPHVDLLDLIGAAADADSVLDHALARIGLGGEELRTLSAVGAPGPDGLSIHDAAEALSVSKSTALRRMRPLEKLGWLEKRGTMVFALTESGQRIEAEGRDICADASERHWAGRLGAADQACLASLLAKMDPASRQG